MIRPFRTLIIIAALAGLLVPLFFVLAHQPRLIPPTPAPIAIRNPDVSQAFYGELRDAPDSYILSTDKPLHLYAAILVPDISSVDKDVFVIATDTHAKSVIFTLNGMTSPWKRFYEPFGGDWYLQGPEIELDIPAGSYNITVNSPDNVGKYILVIGEKEVFPFREIIGAFLTVPRIKLFYFGKSFPETLLSPWGVAFVIVLSLVLLLIFLAVHLSRRHALTQRFISFFSMLYYKYIRKVG